MGGLVGGRDCSVERRGIPTKEACSLDAGDPALRVIQRQGKSSSNMLVKNLCKWITKIKIARNL